LFGGTCGVFVMTGGVAGFGFLFGRGRGMLDAVFEVTPRISQVNNRRARFDGFRRDFICGLNGFVDGFRWLLS